jgi:hypothetical protein
MCSSRRGEASTDNEAWSLYGAQRSQLVATGRKWEGAEMVRRGSTVRVRQRASLFSLLFRPFCCLR